MDDCVGPFRLLRELGRGQNGAVFEAHDTRRDEIVALKVLRIALPEGDPDAADSGPESVAPLRFVREADAIRRLSHPNIVRIRDAGADRNRLYIAMERLHGETLRAKLQRGPLPVPEALSIALQVAAALAFAHGQGIMHRDVKPDNIFLLPDGTAKLMDFGAARVTGENSLTQTGSVIGSPAYMAPEQVSGEETDGRTDVWGLGATLFETVTGQKPFPGDSVASVMYAILHRRPDLSLVPWPALAHVLEKALAKRPSARPTSAAAFADELRRLPAMGDTPTPRGRAAFVPARSLLLAGSAVAAATLLLPIWLLRPQARTSDDRPIAASSGLPAVSAPPTSTVVGKPPTSAQAPAAPQASRTAARPPVVAPVTVEEQHRERAETRPPSPAALPGTAKPASPAKPKRPDRQQSGPVLAGERETPPPVRPAPEREADPEVVTIVLPDEDPAPPKDGAGGGDREALAQFHPWPNLPRSLRGFRGEVSLLVSVDEDGLVTEVEIVKSSGNREVDARARRAALRWEYSPAIKNGRAVPTHMEEVLTFEGTP